MPFVERWPVGVYKQYIRIKLKHSDSAFAAIRNNLYEIINNLDVSPYIVINYTET